MTMPKVLNSTAKPAEGQPSRSSENRQSMSWGVIFNLVGTGSFAFIQLGVLVLIERLRGTEEMGRYSTAVAIVGPLYLQSLFQLRILQLTDGKNETDPSTFWSFRLVTSFSLGVMCLLLSCFLAQEYAPIVAALGLVRAFDAMSDLFQGEFQKRERMDCAALFMTTRSVFYGLAILLGITLFESSLGGVALAAIVSSVLFFLFEIPFYKQHFHRLGERMPRWVFHRKTMTRLILTTFPLSILATCNGLQLGLPRIVVSHLIDTRHAGVFTALSFPALAGGLLVAALLQTSLPRLSRIIAVENDQAVHRFLKRVILVCLTISVLNVVVMSICGNQIVRLLFSASYESYHSVILLMACGQSCLLLGLPAGLWLRASRKFRPVTISRLVSTIFHFLLSLLLTSHAGLKGAACAFFLSELLDAILVTSLAVYLTSKHRFRRIQFPEIQGLHDKSYRLEPVDQV